MLGRSSKLAWRQERCTPPTPRQASSPAQQRRQPKWSWAGRLRLRVSSSESPHRSSSAPERRGGTVNVQVLNSDERKTLFVFESLLEASGFDWPQLGELFGYDRGTNEMADVITQSVDGADLNRMWR